MFESVSGFDWDQGNYEKCQKHGVSIEEIEALFFGKVRVAPDIKHSEAEERFLAIGKSTKGRYIFVAFTFRKKQDQTFVRPISTRYMREKEVQQYEKNLAQNEDG
jgi:uncharacterized protein